jgi:hypothetical protein
LKKIASTKLATDKNKNLLKDALSKALQKPVGSNSNQTPVQNPPPKPEEKKESGRPAEPAQTNDMSHQTKAPEPTKPKEIPEDVLKQILG